MNLETRLKALEDKAEAGKLVEIWINDFDTSEPNTFCICPSATGGSSIVRMGGESQESFRERALSLGRELSKNSNSKSLIIFAE